MVAAILAGGFGTRLRPVLTDKPKVLAQIDRVPFLSVILDTLTGLGLEKVVLCTGYLGEQVQNEFGSSYRGLKLQYSREPEPCGTGGALRLALPLFKSPQVLVLNGDSLYKGSLLPLIQQHASSEASATLLLSQVPDVRRFGSVHLAENNEVLGFFEKHAGNGVGWVSAGVYVINSEVLARIQPDTNVSLERETFPSLIGKGMFGFKGSGEFLDIGTPESFALAKDFIENTDFQRGSE